MNNEQATNKIFLARGMDYSKELLLPENQILKAAQKQREEKEVLEAQALFFEAQEKKQKELEERLETLELLPIANKVILSPYPNNIYKKVLQGKIIVEYNGVFNNPDTGEKDTLETLVGCALVIEVGPECKYVKPGDDVYYDTRTVFPMPFMTLGYKLTSEPQLLAVINEGLKARFNMS